jgi:pilus assembly protein FimV
MHNKLNSPQRNQLQPVITSLRVSAISAAMGILLAVAHVDANALALGRITSLSALGEPLVAGIEVPEINAEEIASLKATLGSPEAFRAAGLEYNPSLANAEISLNRRANGSSYLLVRSDKPVSDPFVNLVVNASWATGRITRNYTLLLDPPEAKQSEAAASGIAAPISALPSPAPKPLPSPAPSTAPAANSSGPAVFATPAPSTPVAMPQSSSTKSSRAAVSVQTVNSGEQVKVNAGDTAGKIAAKNLPANVSLDQMLVAMLRGNPQAFIGGNINRLKSGAVLDLPTDFEAEAISSADARRSLRAQSKDFNAFKRKLAENAPVLASKTPDRVASGKIEAKVEDKKAPAVAPDKLTLSKGGLKADDKTAAKDNSEKIAKERQAKDDADRAAELAKNIKDLNKIASAAPVAGAAATTAAPAAPAATAGTAAAKVATPVVPPVAVTAPVAAATPAAPAAPAVAPQPPKPPVVAAVKKPVPPAPAAPVEKSFIDGLLEDPVILPAAGGLLLLLLGGGWFANKRRKQRLADEEDTILGDEFQDHGASFFSDTSNEPVLAQEAPVEIEPDPVYVQPVKPVVAAKPVAAAATPAKPEVPVAAAVVAAPVIAAATAAVVAANSNAAPNTTSSKVDPLTEADVYLDYGRDPQAEEILKAAMKTQPENTGIYTRLMNIYAKRRDAKNFEQMALKAKAILTEDDPQWLTISKQGFELEPGNPLYAAGTPVHDDTFPDFNNSEFSTRTVAQLNPETSKSPASVDLDLDFDFATSFPTSTKSPEASKSPLINLPDFSLEPAKAVATATSAVAAPAMAATAAVAAASIAAAVTSTAPAAAATNAKPNPMEYDLGKLSLDLNTENKPPAPATAADMNSPLETKLALAQEFRSIGDTIGAKMLTNEVIALATGSLKLRAENLLAELS